MPLNNPSLSDLPAAKPRFAEQTLLIDADGWILAADQTGCRPDHPRTGDNFFDWLPSIAWAGPDLDQILSRLHALLAGREDHYEVTQDCQGEAGLIPATLSAFALADGLARAVVQFRDVSRCRQVLQSLNVANAVFESLQGMMITDPEHRIIRVNRAFTEVTGYGAEDACGRPASFLSSGWHDEEFHRAIWECLRENGRWEGEIWNRRGSGDVYPVCLSIAAVNDATGRVTHYVGAFSDISQHKAAEDEVKQLAFYDPLTHLPNRRLFCDRLSQAQATASRQQDYGALLLIDLDHFKRLNDGIGHAKGDFLLQQVADRLASCLRHGDSVARLGGDEFTVMLVGLDASPLNAAAESEQVGKKILSSLALPYDLDGYVHTTTASMGVILFRDPADSADDLLKRAEVAMYQAKATGRNHLRFYDRRMEQALASQMSLDGDLQIGLRERQFFLVYQPQFDEMGALLGAEALVRWRHPVQGLIAPGLFIPRAEETGLILELGLQLLRDACRQLAQWAQHPGARHLSLAVNVSSSQFRQVDFTDRVIETLEATGIDPSRLKLELTESLLIDNIETVAEKMNVLRQTGITFSLDDFGTGYSSLAYLKNLPFSQLKIDQCFVADLLQEPSDAAIVQTILALGASFHLDVIAEGVETEDQRVFLIERGCRAFQGYLLGRPDSSERLLAALNTSSMTVN